MNKVFVRLFEEAHHGKNTIYPMEGFNDTIGEERRRNCLLNVLMRVPEQDFRKLKEKKFHWYIPGALKLGEIYSFSITHEEQQKKEGVILAERAEVLYLSPVLEDEQWIDEKIVIAVIAHELAHLVLNHSTIVSHEQYELQEKQAWELICKWGFKKEEKAHKKYSKKMGI